MRATASVVGLALVAAVVSVPAYAGGSHTRIVGRSFDERPSVTRVDGLGPGCPDFTGALVERRHLQMSGYVRDGVAHISTVVTATVVLRPASSGATSYRGSYRSVQAGVFDHHGHRTRRVTTLTVGTIHGSDGSTYGTVEVAHSRLGPDGPQGSDRFHCD